MTHLSEEKVEKINAAGFEILERVGVKVLDPKVLARLKDAGARVQTETGRVRFTGACLEKMLAPAPTSFVLYSRDGLNDLHLGSGSVYFGNGGRVFRVLDMKTGGFRPSQLRDVGHTARLVNALENIRFYVIACQAHDLDPDHYHLNDFFHALNNTTKHVMGGCDDPAGLKQMWGLASFIAGGAAQFRECPFVSVITNPISPLTFDGNTLAMLEFCTVKGIPVTCAPAPIAGATGPASLAGTLAQMHAEALAGVAIGQMFSPGARMLYGAVPMAMDLRSMDLTMGSVETAMMNAAAVGLAKRYKLPIYASAGVTDAKTPDIQSGFEKGVSCLLVGMAGADYVHLAAGMLDSGNSISFEQYVIDNEILGMVQRVLAGIDVGRESLAVQCVEQLGPGGNYVAEEHTIDQMFRQFFYPSLTVRMNFDRWDEQGRPSPLTRAFDVVQEHVAQSDGVLDAALVSEIMARFPGIQKP